MVGDKGRHLGLPRSPATGHREHPLTTTAPTLIHTPEHRFGFPMGSDRRLVRWADMLAYFRDLATASPRLRYEPLGTATDGQPFVLLTISDPDNLSRLDELRDGQQRLADPRRIAGDDQRQRLVEQARTVCLVTAGIHATEVGGVQMMPELVHGLVTGDDPETERILSEVLLLLVPSLNPDGMELVHDWYEETLGTPHEGSLPPRLYHRYAGHDNNRDWFMQTLTETRLTIGRIHNVWRPHIVFDLHQMQSNGPRYVVPPFIDPYDPNVDPLIPAQINALGSTIAAELTAQGKTGVATSIIFDAFSPSRAYQHYHGGVRILAEAASVKIATPIEISEEQLADTRGFLPRLSTHNHPAPWPGGRWTLRDIVDYNLVATRTLLDHAARYRDRWIRNFALIQQRSLVRTQPAAFVILPPALQRDPVTTVELLETLRAGDVEIHRASEPFTAEGVEFPAESYLVHLAQPFGGYAKTLLEVQHYPNLQVYPGGPPRPPYDITAHSLPLQMGVTAVQVSQPCDAVTDVIDAVPTPSGGVIEAHDTGVYVVGPETNAVAKLANRLLANGARAARTAKAVLAHGQVIEPGAWVFEDIDRAAADRLGREIGLPVLPVAPASLGQTYAVRAPRVGLYRSWRPNAIDAGWTDLVLQEYEFNVTELRDHDLRQGSLAERCDVIILPHDGSKAMLEGNNPTDYPVAYAGGIGELGISQLRRFVEEGGTLVTLDGACDVAIRHLYLPVTNVLDDIRSDEFYCPGSLLRLIVDPQHPVGWGFEREAAGMFVASPAFDIRTAPAVQTGVTKPQVIAHYPLTNQLLSGWILGADQLAGRAAVIDVPVGRGRVVLIGLRAQFRAQARGTYKLLFNALYAATLGIIGPLGTARPPRRGAEHDQ